ncbi:MAG TPA: 3-hydroxybutyryl-CoA dehydrogenase [Gordonia sp. (in: high G+C Gram-positive bacteria)]|uniref:3-hydroxybutyryl-CoA dehydrogenase n=1 Tax=unclassified Gordonia (in: high G+C Gram-positive bacteria) TaxID=2657482 RepID=UPI000FB898DE|nr:MULTISPECIES: 3-hydroxybutyryl-CoA dehydrogenase [unclassified Gordonia (in: high G+C Gram-positive bacteria)]RUP40288.1 MAG: 3-hydroxybutyryl-CoA dehydrogenase [Gordonia sp. (in: high G+C Gram-positive bacteria)]HNP57242.1 3-hydroxybutyryl-CoA dehydrogenase [Gordonia sp. (in: high G+C Gram-positive bacteria)]HRC49306.1 3-hydroxybutyryl-CoA dehydrogenase [Gordonia sp. (in: high G+C Gram-positive bacteria)]
MKNVGVIGGGTMGAGIAEVVARAGSTVRVVERAEAVEAAQQRIEKSLARAVKSGRLSDDDAKAALGRITITPDLTTLSESELVIEAMPEIEELKVEYFTKLDEIVSADAILATNTSSIPVIRLANATKHPERVLGMHFFNPVPVMALVEIVTTLKADRAIVDKVAAYARDTLGKKTIESKDQAGFIVNALLIPYLTHAIRMFETGFASAEDIDEGMVSGCGHPMGPLRLCDTVGLDICLAVAESLYAEFGEAHYAPPVLLRRMVDAGYLGRKTGRGFYEY